MNMTNNWLNRKFTCGNKVQLYITYVYNVDYITIVNQRATWKHEYGQKKNVNIHMQLIVSF